MCICLIKYAYHLTLTLLSFPLERDRIVYTISVYAISNQTYEGRLINDAIIVTNITQYKRYFLKTF